MYHALTRRCTENCQLIYAIAERQISPSIIEGDPASLSRKRRLSEGELVFLCAISSPLL